MFLSNFAPRGITMPPTMKLGLKLDLKTFLFSFILLLLSCHGKEEPVSREKLLSKGFTLMDQNKYDDAIDYFAELASRDPHYHVKMAWASAYAARAGIQLEQLYSFIVVKNIETLPLSAFGWTADKQTSELIKHLSEYVARWNRIPLVIEKKRVDLQAAVKILNGVPQPGARLYSAALRVVLIKSSVAAGVDNWTLSFGQPNQQICTGDLYPYFQWALRIIDELVSLSADLQAAFPKRKQEFADISDRLVQIKKDAEIIPWPRGNQCL